MTRSPSVGPLLVLSFLVTPHGLLTALRAQTHTAADLTPTAVCDAISAAKDGDVVQLPAGTAVWSKGWNTGRWMPMKAITIQGAGIDRTIIIDNTSTSAGDEPFFIKGVEGKPFRITGITFQGWDGEHYRDAGSWSVISIDGACRDWRIDHCRFLNLAKVIQITGDTCGLIDHCSFEPLDLPVGRLPQLIFVRGPAWSNTGRKAPSSLPQGPGSSSTTRLPAPRITSSVSASAMSGRAAPSRSLGNVMAPVRMTAT